MSTIQLMLLILNANSKKEIIKYSSPYCKKIQILLAIK